MPRRYPADFRRKVTGPDRVRKTGRRGRRTTGTTAQTVYNWRNQDQIDRGLRARVSTALSASTTRCADTAP